MADATAKAAHLISFYPDDFVAPYRSGLWSRFIGRSPKPEAKINKPVVKQQSSPLPQTYTTHEIKEFGKGMNGDKCFTGLFGEHRENLPPAWTAGTALKNFEATVNYKANIQINESNIVFGGCLHNFYFPLILSQNGKIVQQVRLRDDVSLITSLLGKQVPTLTLVLESVQEFNEGTELRIDSKPCIYIQFKKVSMGTTKRVFFFASNGKVEKISSESEFEIADPIVRAKLF